MDVHKVFVKVPEQKLTERANRFSCSVSLCKALRTPAVVAGFTATARAQLASTARTLHVPLCQNENLLPWIHQRFSTAAPDKAFEKQSEEKEKISVTFVDKDGEEKHIRVPVGMSMLEAAHENDLELEGACEGSLACSTCHVIVMDPDYYNKLEDPTDEENDMLDLAFGLTETSRLGCQIIAHPDIDGIRLALPAATRNFAVDGYKPKPH